MRAYHYMPKKPMPIYDIKVISHTAPREFGSLCDKCLKSRGDYEIGGLVNGIGWYCDDCYQLIAKS